MYILALWNIDDKTWPGQSCLGSPQERIRAEILDKELHAGELSRTTTTTTVGPGEESDSEEELEKEIEEEIEENIDQDRGIVTIQYVFEKHYFVQGHSWW